MKNFKFIVLALAVVGINSTAYAESDPSKWPLVKEAFFAQRQMADAPFITFVAPRRAESGAQVPLEIAIDQTQADANAIKTLYVLVDSTLFRWRPLIT